MSDLEDLLAYQLLEAEIPFEREARIIPDRRFRWDFWIPTWDKMTSGWYFQRGLLIEVQGGTWRPGSKHVSGKGYEIDCEKLNLAVEKGFYTLWFTSKMIKDCVAIETIKRIVSSDMMSI